MPLPSSDSRNNRHMARLPTRYGAPVGARDASGSIDFSRTYPGPYKPELRCSAGAGRLFQLPATPWPAPRSANIRRRRLRSDARRSTAKQWAARAAEIGWTTETLAQLRRGFFPSCCAGGCGSAAPWRCARRRSRPARELPTAPGTKVIETGADLASDVPARRAKQIKGLADYQKHKKPLIYAISTESRIAREGCNDQRTDCGRHCDIHAIRSPTYNFPRVGCLRP
jgi:hypothetical protein